MEYYKAEKINDILNFAGKWMELENIILSEVTQIQKDNYHMYSLIGGFYFFPNKTFISTCPLIIKNILPFGIYTSFFTYLPDIYLLEEKQLLCTLNYKREILKSAT